MTNAGERIECHILDMGFPDIKIHPKYGFVNYSIPRQDIQQITFRDGRELLFLNGVGMPAESLAKRTELDREIEQRAGIKHRVVFTGLGLVGGTFAGIGTGIVALKLIFDHVDAVGIPLGLLVPFTPLEGSAIGYNYGKHRDLDEAREKILAKPPTDSLTLRLQKMMQK